MQLVCLCPSIQQHNNQPTMHSTLHRHSHDMPKLTPIKSHWRRGRFPRRHVVQERYAAAIWLAGLDGTADRAPNYGLIRSPPTTGLWDVIHTSVSLSWIRTLYIPGWGVGVARDSHVTLDYTD